MLPSRRWRRSRPQCMNESATCSGPLRSDGGLGARRAVRGGAAGVPGALPAAVVEEMDAFRDDEKRAAAEAREARKARVAAKKGRRLPSPPKPSGRRQALEEADLSGSAVAAKPAAPPADPEEDADLICRPKKSPAKPSSAKARKPAAAPKPAKKSAKPAARKPSVAKQAAKPAKKATAAKRPN